MGKIQDGKLKDPKVKLKMFATIERGLLKKVAAIVVHQTGAATAESTFQSYKGPANGAHFLIDKDGTIYQTARLTQRTFHVGKIKSRCLETHKYFCISRMNSTSSTTSRRLYTPEKSLISSSRLPSKNCL